MLRGRTRVVAILMAAILLPPLFAACGERAAERAPRPAAAPEEPSGDAPLVIFIGDSLSAGLGLTGEAPFPEHARALLRERGMEARIINAGVSGDTTAGGLERLPWLLRQRPDIVVIELGANDGLRGQPHRATRDNLDKMIRAARDGGAEVLLLGMQIPPSYGRPYADGFAAIYGDLSRDLDVALVEDFLDGVGGNAAMNLTDGMHPNGAGHRRLAENILPELVELIERRSE
jgi:acyl-CoA thioesterase-1